MLIRKNKQIESKLTKAKQSWDLERGRLNKVNSNLRNMIMEIDYGAKKYMVPTLSDFLIQNMINNLKYPLNGRRYTSTFYDISMLLYLQAPKCYRLLQQLLPFPSKHALMNKYSGRLLEIKHLLTNLSYKEKLIKNMIKVSGPCTLAIDAFAFQSFRGGNPVAGLHHNSQIAMSINNETSSMRNRSNEGFEDNAEDYMLLQEIEQQEKDEMNPTEFDEQTEFIEEGKSETDGIEMNNGFIFFLAPLDPNYSPKMIHLEPAPNGSYSKRIDEIANTILNELRNCQIDVLFKATDGDPGVSSQHEIFFDNYITNNRKIFHVLISNIYMQIKDKNEIIPVSDPLHFLKCFRGRLIDNSIMVFPSGRAFNSYDLKQILQVGSALQDKTHLSRMRDSYVIKLFTMENVCKLFSAEHYDSAFVFFAFSCITSAIYSISIKQSLRLFLLELSYHCFQTILENIPLLKSVNVTERRVGNCV